MTKKVSHKTAHGSELVVEWTADGLEIWMDGVRHIPSLIDGVAYYAEFGMCDQARFAQAEREARRR